MVYFGHMTWNYAPEIISACFLIIILTYSLRYRLVPNRRNRMFVKMVVSVLILIFLSIGTVLLSSHPTWAPNAIDLIIHTLFFMSYPMVPILFLWYLITVIFEHAEFRINRFLILSYLPKLIYDVVVLANPLTHQLFVITDQGYLPQSGEFMIFAVAIFYMILIMALMIRYHKAFGRQLTLVILSYNVIFILFLLVEYVNPSLVLGGSAATLFILILYLYIQNKEVMTDRLTNLMNRQSAVEQLRLLDKSDNSAQLILISLADFRTVNGLYGQAFGDALLRSIADFLISLSRLDEVYRYSGDLFLLILRDDAPQSDKILQALIERFKKPFAVGERSTTLRAKFVYTHYPQHVRSSENAVALLEFLVAKVKADPKAILIESSQQSMMDMTRRSQVLECVKKAIEEDGFTIALQPIYSVKDQSFQKAEALLRLQDEKLGPISPSEFIPLAEEAGLITKIGKHVTRKTIEFIKQCNDEGLFLDSISVNYSANHISHPLLAQEILTAIEQARIFPSQLKIEITESIFIHEYDQIIANIEALKKAGIGIYLDDFGTGFSNLASVIKLPLDIIKFDRSLILEASTSEKTQGMIKGLISAFKDIGFTTLAEGVETEDQETMVEGMGFDFVQGFLKSRPLSPSDFVLALKEKSIKK